MKVLKFRHFALWVLLLVFATSCLPDENEDDPRLDWVGSWTCNETSGDFAPQVYNITIDLGSGTDGIVMRGLYNQGSSFRVDAIVSARSLTIPNQSTGGFQINGGGSANSNFTRIDFNFTINDGGGADNVQAYLVR